MHRPLFLVLLSVWATLTLAACGGSGPVVPPDNFTRLTASVVDSAGQPVSGLSVRVEGTNTGVTTDAGGNFSLGREAFPNGVTARNEISLGRNGVVMGVGEYVPAIEPVLQLQFGVNFGLEQPGGPPDPNLEPGSLSGNVFNESTGEALTGVELTLFSNTGQLLSTTSDNGFYEFDPVAAGDWRLTAFFAGYHPEAAAVSIPEGAAMVQHLSLVPEGVVSPGDGLKVQGTLRDSDTGEPIAGATISMMADTGYIGMPEQGFIDDMDGWTDTVEPSPSTGVFTEPGSDKGPSMAPWNYDPQYQETTTAADGTFEFEQEVIGYSLWLDYYAEGYLNGNHYEDIYERTGVLDLNLELDPYVSASITGIVADGDGLPLEGAYVEFIYAGGFDSPAIGIAMPGVMDFETMADDGTALRGDIGAPAPPPSSDPTEGSNGWDEWADAAQPMYGGAEQGGSPNSGPGVDNQMMQRFRWENQQGGRGTSDAYFTGYYGTNTDENGEFSFEDVPAGPYYVFASAYRHLPYDSMLEVFEDSAENVFEIVLQHVPVGAVEGIITDENGTPLPDVLVTCTQPNVDPFSYTDEDGYYIIDNVPTGMWIISGYKTGYLTYSVDTAITENATAQVDLSIERYEPPQQTVIAYSGHVVNGSDNSGVVGADVVFTPVNNEFGQWYQHLTSGSNGAYSAQLIATEYNVLIQQNGFEDLYIRIWVDSTYPQMDFWLWPIGGGGGVWGGGPMPMMDAAMGMPERGGGM